MNIRADGSLDVADEDLATRDWVVASVHSSFDKNPTERVLAAMENPYVDCIGHLTGRRIGTRPPSPVDVERVIEAALRTGTFLEINAQPDRLDLTDVHARAAREAGLKLVDRLGRPPDQRARLRRARRGAGAARVADEGGRAEHADVEADREAPEETAVTLPRRPRPRCRLGRGVPRRCARAAGRLAGRARGHPRGCCPSRAPEAPEPFAAMLRDLDQVLMPGITHWNHPRFFAWFANTGSEPGVLAELLTAALNVNAMTWLASPAGTELELTVLDWLAQLLGLPRGWHGHIEDTASTSTIAALAAARTLRPGGVVYASEQANFVVEKAARLVGLEFRPVPVDDEFRMRTDFPLDDATAVVATVGTTGTTSVDPVPELARRCEEAGVWLHVDAAYAGSAAICPELRWCLDGCRACRLDRRQPAQVAVHADGLLDVVDAASGGVPRGVRRAAATTSRRPTRPST